MKKFFILDPFEKISHKEQTETLQHSTFRCTRCNACAQSCPSYHKHAEESFSPRGRVQILRLLLEGKIKYQHNKTLIDKTVKDCILCGRCTCACAGNIPIAELMISLRRAANLHEISWPIRIFLHWHTTQPRLFDVMVRTVQKMRRLKLWPLCGGGFRFLQQINTLHRLLPAPKYTLRQILAKEKLPFHEKKPSYLYLPSLEACYIDPHIGLLSLKALKGKKTHVLFGFSSGLFEYLYGKKHLSLQAAKRLLVAWEKKSSQKPIPLVTDSIETFYFLKKYAMLFPEKSNWQKRAVAFSKEVRYIADFISVNGKNTCKTVLDTSALLSPSRQAVDRTQKILKTHFGKNLLECEYSRFPMPLAGAIFTQSRAMLLENVRGIAQRQIKQVFCLSALASFQLNALLNKHYPAAKAQHIVYLQEKNDRI